MGRAGAASLILLLVLGVFGAAGVAVLQLMPSAEERTQTVRAERSGPRGTGPARESSAPIVEKPKIVRYVDEDGIVATRVEGPLTRARSAVKLPEKPPPGPELLKLVVIESAGLINARKRNIQLAHIDAPSADHQCTDSQGTVWPCGRRARTALRRLVRRRALECSDVKSIYQPPEGPSISTCLVAKTDLSRWLIEQGWATPTKTAPEEWTAVHEEAKAAGRGVYRPEGR
ncbi:MAG: thermonuclease family protein [Devosia sp.]